ncbi:MAG TPA: CAP domain-containing protein [Solirubrobacteraceae bacterium]
MAALLAPGASAAAPCAGADDVLPNTHDAARAKLGAVRATITCLVNSERRARGLRAWRTDLRLENAAQMRANDLVDRRYFSHHAADGRDASTELRDQWYPFAVVGENLVRGYDTPAHTVRAWLTTWSHCSVMLDPALTEVGTGIAFGAPLTAGDGRGLVLFAAQLAARPAGTRAPKGRQKPRLRCPYWGVTPHDEGWDWTRLTVAESARVRCDALRGVSVTGPLLPAVRACRD